MIKLTLGNGAYRNIRAEFSGFIPEIIGDSYLIEDSLRNTNISISDYLVRNFNALINHVKMMSVGEKAFLPFGIFDQSVTYIVVKKLNQRKLNIYYLTDLLIYGDYSLEFDSKLNYIESESSSIIGGQLVNIEDFELEFENEN